MVAYWVDGDGDGRICVVDPARVPHVKKVEVASHNEAEWYALIMALGMIRTYEPVTIYTDSQLVAGQFHEVYKVRAPNLIVLRDTAYDLVDKRQLDVTVEWIPGKESVASIYLRSTR